MTRNLNWLSFCDPDLPKGTQFLGIAIIEAPCFELAVPISHLEGCNPGGEIAGYEIGDKPVPEKYLHRLLNKKELRKLEKIMDAALNKKDT